MFESHFGLSAPPFQLNPDPSFYFGSKGHSNALAYLQYGVHQAEGFIVVTGEIGAGKTTLVRTLLDGLDASQVKAAQIASTQLDATGLLQAMLTAFGVPPPAVISKASLISTLEAFFMTLAIKNKRALLVVDEAQNLSMDAIEELRMLSNFQLRKQALLQSFLVGQPELRSMLESQRLEQLRQRVIASCHLGPLDVDETRRYIEHRLNRVGWQGDPAFNDDAYPRIHQATGGIPRRVNLLCNRALLAAFLENLGQIDAGHIDRIAAELRSEVGESSVELKPAPPVEPVQPVQVQAQAQAQRPAALRPAQQYLQPVYRELPIESPIGDLHRIVRNELPADWPTVLCLVDSPASYLQAAVLAAAFEGATAPGRMVVVGCRSVHQLGQMENFAEAVNLPSFEVHLGVDPAASPARRSADAVLRFQGLIDEFAPRTVMALGLSDEVLSCSVLAARHGIAVVRPDAGWLPPERFSDWRLNAAMLDRLAARLFVPGDAAAQALAQEGVPFERLRVTGSLMLDAVHAAAALGGDAMAQALLTHHGLSEGFVLVTSRVGDGRLAAAQLSGFLNTLARVRADRPMLWLVCGETQSALRAQGLGTLLSRSGIALASNPVFSSRLNLLQRAAYLVTDPVDDLVEVAVALGKKILLVDPLAEAGSDADSDPVAAVRTLSFESQNLGPALSPRELRNPEGGAASAMVRHLHEPMAAELAPAARPAQGT